VLRSTKYGLQSTSASSGGVRTQATGCPAAITDSPSHLPVILGAVGAMLAVLIVVLAALKLRAMRAAKAAAAAAAKGASAAAAPAPAAAVSPFAALLCSLWHALMLCAVPSALSVLQSAVEFSSIVPSSPAAAAASPDAPASPRPAGSQRAAAVFHVDAASPVPEPQVCVRSTMHICCRGRLVCSPKAALFGLDRRL
jgi:hypothetical protein